MPKKYPIVINQATDDKDAEILLYGPIGKSFWDNEGISGKEFNDALKQFPKGTKVTVAINSQGGAVFEGLAIYNAIARRSEDITARIDGYALSAASFLPLAAGKVQSPRSAIWMIHSASGWNEGNEKDMRKYADLLETHDQTIINAYVDKTGKTEKEIRAAMEEETWMTGDEAIAWGLADEESENEPAFNKVDLSKAHFKNVPGNLNPILAMDGMPKISPAAVGRESVTVAQATQTQIIMNKQEMLDLLKSHSITTPDNATNDEIKALVGKLPVAKPATAPAAVIGDNTVLAAQLNAVIAQLENEKRNRIVKAVDQCVIDCRIVKDQAAFWVEQSMKDESVLAKLQAMPQNVPGTEPLNSVIQVSQGFETPLAEIQSKHKTPMARKEAMKSDWKALYADALARDNRRGSVPMNTNTYSGTLVTSFLMDGSLTDLQNMWAALGAFSIDYTTDSYKPLATGVLKHVTAGATAQTDATNFESGNSTVAPLSVIMHQYTVSFQVSNSDLNSGLRMENLVKINTANFANKVTEIATAPITQATFTNTPLISAAAAFGFSDLATLQASLKKSSIKNLILDGAYIARVANTPAFFQLAGTVGGASAGQTGAWKAFGWDLIAQLTDWTGAGANTQGFACNPQAIVGVTGLPLTPPNIPGGILTQNTMTVPGLETPVAVYNWFNPSTRTMWCSYDIMLGVTAGDATAGTIVASA